MNSSTLSTSAASLSPEQQRLGDEHNDGGVTAKNKDGKIKARIAMRRLARLVQATEGVTKAEELFVVANLSRAFTKSARLTLIQISSQKLD